MTTVERMLRLDRHDRSPLRTIGRLSLDGEYLCWTLEDPVRDLNPTFHAGSLDQAVQATKVPGRTAIPAGRYRVVREDSPKFGPDTLTLLDVPGFTHIHIHAGNRVEDTSGCLLVGDKRGENEIYQSRQALARLKAGLPTTEEIWLTIIEP